MTTQRDRASLRNLFQQGAKPTGDDFADLIESGLNIVNDGIRPGAGPDNPPVITARGEKKNFLDLEVDSDNHWRLEHLPDPEDAGLGFAYNGGVSLFLEAGTGNIGIGSTAPNARLTVDGEIRSGAGADNLSLSHDGANAALEARGAGSLNIRQGDATRIAVGETGVSVLHDFNVTGASVLHDLNVTGASVLHDLDVTAKVTANQNPPFVFKRYKNITNDVTYTTGFNTGYSTSDYAAAIIGFCARGGTASTSISSFVYLEQKSTWIVWADQGSTGTNETWNFDVMFVRKEFADRTETWGKLH